MKTLRTLLTGIIDYAGLFPPAALDMLTAVQTYAQARASRQNWMLGRFVVPAQQLDTFAEAAAPHLIVGDQWRLSALISENTADDLAAVQHFNQQQIGALVDTLEIKVATPAAIRDIKAQLPDTFTSYVEFPLHDNIQHFVQTIKRHGLRAKIRTGGVTPEMFPHSGEVIRFIDACAHAELPFKATAGLHHAIRGNYRLTYAPLSASTMMYGFLNLFIAAVFVRAGMSPTEAVDLLQDTNPMAFVFDKQQVIWRKHRATVHACAQTRAKLAISFGSCSFYEPVQELYDIYELFDQAM